MTNDLPAPTGRYRIKAVGASSGPDGRPARVAPDWRSRRNDLEDGSNFPRRPRIEAGDQSFLYAVGDGLFALVMHIGDPYPDDRFNDRFGDRWSWRIDHVVLRFVPNLFDAIPLGSIQPGTRRNNPLTLSIRQKSHFELFPDEIAQALALTANWQTT